MIQAPATAQTETRAQLRLLVVDRANVPLPSATVTLFTLDGNPGVTVTADEKGVALFPATAVGLAEIVARHPGHSPYIEKATLKAGSNAETVTLHPVVDEESDTAS